VRRIRSSAMWHAVGLDVGVRIREQPVGDGDCSLLGEAQLLAARFGQYATSSAVFDREYSAELTSMGPQAEHGTVVGPVPVALVLLIHAWASLPLHVHARSLASVASRSPST
jgi:hypothetical protein